jgi:hypothetical protein
VHRNSYKRISPPGDKNQVKILSKQKGKGHHTSFCVGDIFKDATLNLLVNPLPELDAYSGLRVDTSLAEKKRDTWLPTLE